MMTIITHYTRRRRILTFEVQEHLSDWFSLKRGLFWQLTGLVWWMHHAVDWLASFISPGG